MNSKSHLALDIRNLTVQLPPGADRPYAVENVSVSVRRGELVCIVGESGSGKSITAFTAMGLLPKGLRPIAGEVWVHGEDIIQATPSRVAALRGVRMGMIFQEPMTALNPVLTVGDQIDEVLRIHTNNAATSRKGRVLDVMRAMHLPDPDRLYSAYPHQLSGGQRQRVVIAMAMVLEPDLLIADEPTTALDVTTQAQILVLIKELQSRLGIGVLFITHDFGVVADIADRVVVMQSGRVVEEGNAKDVLSRPKHPYTQTLIAAVPAAHPSEKLASPGAPALSVTGLNKTYGTRSFLKRARIVSAVKNVTFDLRRGETVGIVGESGSGKSTVARCIARLIKPSDGRVQLGDVDIAGLGERSVRPHRRHIQIVFQDPFRSLNPRRTIRDALIEGPMNYGVSQKRALAKASELLELVRLPQDALRRFPHQFSGGQRQRIAIARALAMEPDILIADEAVSALDVSVQKQVLQLLEDARNQFNLAMLFITHDLRVAAQICDRVLVMKNGEVVETGPTYSVFRDPQHAYTKGMIAASPGQGFAFGGVAH